MQFVKLQLGCLLVMAYIEITYIVATLRGKIPCNRFFDALMVVSPWAMFFDGFTAWTVNHMDIVPAFLNRGAHLLFFVFMDLTGTPCRWRSASPSSKEEEVRILTRILPEYS